ncbi:zinc-dependent metalloprotease [Thalassomonas viridans]|uniref:Zinc-dependent metalloprotease n=1 Tax=Thalassomonas viridans TaxID=137584 RepID=A0AAF0C6U7_9GAMM|nr:zinc-dependent metalloprotease [Thalassomonas viridans]WDE04587.1 zinc-dependent metalloprotease [Thalassomonas viridans]
MNFFRPLILLFLCSVHVAYAGSNFSDFIKDKSYHPGFYSFYHDEDQGKVYLEIKDFGQEFLFQSSLPHGIGSNDIGLDRGQLGDTRLVRFERSGNKVFLRQLNTYYRADSDNALERQAVEEAFATSILWGFELVKLDDQKQQTSVLIDYTPFLLSDIHNLATKLDKRKQGKFKADTSRSGLYKKRSKAFPDNTEFEAIVTFKGSKPGDYLRSVTPDANIVSVHMHHSLIRLPDAGYQPREFHPFSGFWSIEYADYASAIDQPLLKRIIPRHRLEKKNPSARVSEAVEPIVYYLDPGVPEPVRSALIDGALWWDQAFSALGYKNAFQVKILPEDADPMDVRYNVIQWVHRATRGWSYGSSVIDPRTGEILKGHVTLGSLRVRQDYLIATGLTSPYKKRNADTTKMKEMALARIRQLSAHEVGHTLGIAHNFAASTNNRASVMDYPHPDIKVRRGKIDLSQAYATDIGEWDKYVIAYGYGDQSPQQRLELISQVQERGLKYSSDPDARPVSGGQLDGHLWDNGKDAVKGFEQVAKVRKKALAQFGINNLAYGRPLSELEQVLVPVYNYHRYQLEAVVKLIAGVDYFYETRDDETVKGVSNISGKQQQAALTALLSTLDSGFLTLPEHILALIPPKAYGYQRNRESFSAGTGLTFDAVSAAEASAKYSIGLLLNAERLARLQQQAALDAGIPGVKAVLEQLLDATLKTQTQTQTKSGMAMLVQQRVNQQVVDQLLTLWLKKALVPEVRADIYAALVQLQSWLSGQEKQALSAHYRLLAQQIGFGLNKGKQVVMPSEIKMAPGSPIGG